MRKKKRTQEILQPLMPLSQLCKRKKSGGLGNRWEECPDAKKWLGGGTNRKCCFEGGRTSGRGSDVPTGFHNKNTSQSKKASHVAKRERRRGKKNREAATGGKKKRYGAGSPSQSGQRDENYRRRPKMPRKKGKRGSRGRTKSGGRWGNEFSGADKGGYRSKKKSVALKNNQGRCLAKRKEAKKG